MEEAGGGAPAPALAELQADGEARSWRRSEAWASEALGLRGVASQKVCGAEESGMAGHAPGLCCPAAPLSGAAQLLLPAARVRLTGRCVPAGGTQVSVSLAGPLHKVARILLR